MVFCTAARFWKKLDYLNRTAGSHSESSKICTILTKLVGYKYHFHTYQHCRWKAAGQWSQHRRSPPSWQLSQMSWLVALLFLRTSLSLLRFLFSPSSDLGGASSVWICCNKLNTYEKSGSPNWTTFTAHLGLLSLLLAHQTNKVKCMIQYNLRNIIVDKS